MTRRVVAVLTILVGTSLLAGCAFNRANVSDLAVQQRAYYQELRETLQANRSLLETGLTIQVEQSEKSRQNLANWVLDLRRAEVLLQVDLDVSGNKELLSYKLAEIDLATIENANQSRHHVERAEAILKLYDNVIAATDQLESNSDDLVDYLAEGNRSFLISNLDIDGIVRTIAGIQVVREQLAEIEERSEEEKKAESEKIHKSIERVRDVLIKALESDST